MLSWSCQEAFGMPLCKVSYQCSSVGCLGKSFKPFEFLWENVVRITDHQGVRKLSSLYRNSDP
jgi:hypothetical protein